MASVAANTRFSWLGDKLQEVETGAVGSKAQRGTAKRDLMRAVFDEIKRKGGGQTTNIFEFLRLILPEEDKARQYHLKEAMLIELYIKVLGAGAELTRKLEKWRTPGASGGGALRGDMADAVSHQLKERCPHSKGLSVLDVANLLDQLSAAQSGDKADRQKARESVIARAITNMDFKEHKWFIRIILRNLRLGLSTEKILAAYHPSAAALFTHASNLEEVCRKCAVPGYVHDGTELAVFTPVHAMLANQATIEKAARKLTGDFVVEDKMDGERVMIHFGRSSRADASFGSVPAGGGASASAKLAFWTRSRKDFTKQYEADMAPILEKALLPSVVSCILDGEMMAWDEEGQRHLTLNQGSSRCIASVQSAHIYKSYFAFDMLFLNGRNLTGMPLSERKALLQQHLAPIPHRLELTVGECISRSDSGGVTVASRLTERLNSALENGYEGLMCKPLDGIYVPNARNYWLKIKPDYDEGYFQTIDLLVLGGYYGEAASGRHWKSNGVSHFLVGLKAPPSTPQMAAKVQHPPVFTFCKVGTGYSGAELKRMREVLDPIAVKWSDKPLPPHLCGWKPGKSDDVPDVWYPPKRSLVLEVKAYELVKADPKMWRAGLCLRFPRVTTVRWDKGFDDAATVDQVAALHEDLKRTNRTLGNVGRGNGTGGGGGGEDKRPPQKKQRTVPQVLGGKLPSAYTAEPPGYDIVLDLFDEEEVVVLTSHRQHEFFMMAAEHGAMLSVNVTHSTRFVIVDPELIAGAEQAKRTLAAQKRTLDQRAVDLIERARTYRRWVADTAEAEAAAAEAAAKVAEAAEGGDRGGGTGRGKRPSSTAASRRTDEKAALAVNAAIDFTQLNIVTSTWLERCVAAKQLLPIEPREALHMSEAAAAARDEIMDEWGDRFTEETTPDELREAMALVRRQRLGDAASVGRAPHAQRLAVAGGGGPDGGGPRGGDLGGALADAETVPDVHAILSATGLEDDEVLRLDPPPAGALRHPRRCVALVPPDFASGVQDSLHPLRGSLACRVVQLLMLGARVVHEPTDAVTTVVLPSSDENSITMGTALELRRHFQRLQAAGGLVHAIAFVRGTWVDACRREAGWADESEHRIEV